MSKDNPLQNNEPQNKSGTGVKFALFAGILGIAAGAGLYALFGGDDNTVKLAGGCQFNADLAKKIDKAAQGNLAAFRAIDRAYSVAELTFNNVDGQEKKLADWKGKTVLLNLWATWCAPCRAEMPALDELQSQLGGEKFEVLPVSVDLGEDEKPKKFFADISIKNMRFFHDGTLETLNSLKKDGLAFGLPATLLIDPNGCVLGTLNGPAEWASEDAVRLVKAAM